MHSLLKQLEELPGLVEEFLRELAYLIGRKTVVRDYETIPEKRTSDSRRRGG
jgi:hypothetical protein